MRVLVDDVQLVDGGLEVLRDGVWVQQYCPFANDGPRCGTWCPLCGCIETQPAGDYNIITICQDRTLVSAK